MPPSADILQSVPLGSMPDFPALSSIRERPWFVEEALRLGNRAPSRVFGRIGPPLTLRCPASLFAAPCPFCLGLFLPRACDEGLLRAGPVLDAEMYSILAHVDVGSLRGVKML